MSRKFVDLGASYFDDVYWNIFAQEWSVFPWANLGLIELGTRVIEAIDDENWELDPIGGWKAIQERAEMVDNA